ncbi:MAG TPA: LanC-like protein [Ramlibacter sp.]|nr:LanC-like protein [Ramlibacter sp.]
MLYSPDRHEPLAGAPWSEGVARAAIERIVALTEQDFSADTWWPPHPQDSTKRTDPWFMLYLGAAGVIWSLRFLEKEAGVRLSRDYRSHVERLLELNRVDMGEDAKPPFGSYLMGDTSIRMLDYDFDPQAGTAAEIAALVAGTLDQPTREQMWGSPGTLLAALLMHRRTGERRWADLFNLTARKLWSQLEWSEKEQCHFWSQDMYGEHSDYLDAVHGFAGTALPLIQGRELMEPAEWERWKECIANTMRRNAEWDGGLVNWRARLSSPRGALKLVQYCHGAPGFVVCLADFPGDAIDDLLEGGAQLTWQAGPLTKGSNLCHGTGGNGYAFLKMFKRTGDEEWLDRARAFAMHGIAQTEAALQKHGHLRHSLWTGDPGFAIYLLECIRGGDLFPTLDVF